MWRWVGFDAGKASHWACVLDGEGEVLLSRRVENTERGPEACLEEVAGLGDERWFAIDLLGGPAAMLEAALLEWGERVFHLPGMAVNQAREGYPGGGQEARGVPPDTLAQGSRRP